MVPLFILAIGVAIAIGVWARFNGDENKISHGYKFEGELCGVDKDEAVMPRCESAKTRDLLIFRILCAALRLRQPRKNQAIVSDRSPASMDLSIIVVVVEVDQSKTIICESLCLGVILCAVYVFCSWSFKLNQLSRPTKKTPRKPLFERGIFPWSRGEMAEQRCWLGFFCEPSV